MSKAKLLITLALIGCIHQFYDGTDTDLARTHATPGSCGVDSKMGDVPSAGADTDAIGGQQRSCADSMARRDPPIS